MDKLRTPFFLVAALVLLLAVLLESGSGWFLKSSAQNPPDFDLKKIAETHGGTYDPSQVDKLSRQPSPPGMAIPQMALLDCLVLFTVILMGAHFLFTDRVSGKLQGIASLIVSILALLGGMAQLFVDITKVLEMVSLFISAPFGTIAYLVVWGSFNRDGATAVLAASMGLKLAFVVLLLLAHQRFIQNKGLVLIILTSLLANVIVSFLHGIAPIILVSITDGIGAIIATIFALLWAIAMLIGAIIAIVKAIS